MPDPSISSAVRTGHIARAAALLGALPDRLRRPVAKGAYRAEIDGLRFVAIAIVVVGHFMERAIRFFPAFGERVESNPLGHLLARPGIGVYLFFAISGFVIARQVAKAQSSPLGGAFLQSYFGRRILRIEPPYVLLLLVTWLLIALTGYVPDKTTHFDTIPASLTASAFASILYLHDLLWGTYPRLFPPGWSLEVEVQFYLLAPLLMWAFLRARTTFAAIVLGALGLVGGALLSVVAPDNIGPVHTSFSILQFFTLFWLGIVLARSHRWIIEATKPVSPSLVGLLGWVGLVAYVAMPAAPLGQIGLSLVVRAANLAALTAMFVGAFVEGSSFRRFCQRPWISVIGGACYSIYLTHLQVIQIMTGAMARLVPHGGVGLIAICLIVEAMVVVVVGMIFYVLIERTFMIKDWPTRFWSGVMDGFARLRPNAAGPAVRAPSGRRG